MIYAEQLRVARGLLGWNQSVFSSKSGLPLSTIKRMEPASGPVRGNSQNVWKIQHSLKEASVVFLDANGGGPRVRLKYSPP